MEKTIRVFRVYGKDGHRQRESFFPSFRTNFREGKYSRGVLLTVENADRTGTNEYSIVRLVANSNEEILNELKGQVTDGVFEDCKVGKVTEVIDGVESVFDTSEWWA